MHKPNSKIVGGGNGVNFPVVDTEGTPFAAVKFTFVNVTPELASAWLKRNHKNRKLRDLTVEAYAMDVRNGAWMTTHQGIAFDAYDNLIDGQHRLNAIVRAKKPVLMLIVTGWPSAAAQRKTMDAVDRGAARSLADQLHLQHDIAAREASRVVQICNAIAAASFGLSRVRKSTTDTILGVFGLYKTEILWVMNNPIVLHGLKQATVAGCLAMARALWPQKIEDFTNRLMTGENLTKDSPILHLRNWLMGDGKHADNADIRNAFFHHACAFVDGKSVSSLVMTSNASSIRVWKLSKVRTEKICGIYNQPVPEFLRDEPASPANGSKFNPLGKDGITLGARLSDVFSTTDLIARTDENAGQILLIWMNHKWIEGIGAGQYRKTEKFGQ